MRIFQIIDINMDAERARVDKPGTFDKRQKKALHRLYDLFEAGEWQKCLDHVRDAKAFPENSGGYSETEHIGVQVSDVLKQLGHENFVTQEALLEEAKEVLDKRAKDAILLT